MPRIKSLQTKEVRRLQRGGLDENNQTPEVLISDGKGNQCRHCLELIRKGEELLLLSYKPFKSNQPYAELGPIFLHKRECNAYSSKTTPEILQDSNSFLLRGYDINERIVSGTGKVVASKTIEAYALNLFAKKEVEFIHIRSASNNCYQARIDRE